MAGGETEDNLTARLISVAQWLADDQSLRNDVISWLAEQTGLKPVFIRPVINGLLIVGSRVAGHAGAAALSHAMEGLLRIPFIEQVVAGLERLHAQGATRQQLERRFREAIGDDADLPLSAGLEVLQATFLLQTLSRHDDVLKELQGDLASGLSQLQEQLAELAQQNNLVRADLLTIPQHPGTDGILARLRFTSGLHPFVGREVTLQHLGKFLAAPGSEQGDFRWMLLTAPGGFGKSRLAYELCLNPALASDNALHWHAGFLSADKLEKFSNSVLDAIDTPRPLLIVVDYAARLPGQLAILMQRLTERAASFSHSVRLLLLERPQMGRWAEELLPPGLSASSADPRAPHWPEPISSDSNDIPSYDLPLLADEAIVQLMRARLQDVDELAHLKDDQLLAFVARVSGEREELRPLLALATAEFLRDSPDDVAKVLQGKRAWLFNRILERERESWWRPAARDDEALTQGENLLALATFCGGIERRQWRELPNVLTEDGLLPRPRDFQNMRPLLERMGMRADNHLPPLEPDILGEHFVLQRLREIAECGDDLAQAFRDTAWQLGAADDRAHIFLLRALADFTGRIIDADFLAPSPAAGEQAAYAFSRAAVNVSNMVGTLLRFLWPLTTIAPADDILEEVRSFSTSLDRLFSCTDALRQQFPDNADIALHEAMAAVNVTNHADKAEDWEQKVKNMLRRIDTLRQQFPENAGIALYEAMAAHNVIYCADKAKDWGQVVKDMLQRIDALRQKFPDNTDIAIREAMTAVNITKDADQAEDWEQVMKDMLRRIDALRQQFPDNADIALHEVGAVVNVTSHAGAAEKWGLVKSMLRRIDALRQQFPDNADIALEEAKAAVNVTSHAVVAARWPLVEDMLQRLNALRQKLPDKSDIALQKAFAHAALGGGRLLHDDAAKATHLLRRALELMQEHLPRIMTDAEHQKRFLAISRLYLQACQLAGQEPDWQGLEQIREQAQLIAAANSGTPLSPWAAGWRAGPQPA